MTAVTILIKWRWAREVLTLDLNALKRGAQILRTTETWSGVLKPYIYNTTSRFDPDNTGGGTLTIVYAATNNPHMKDLDCRWGTSVIHLDSELKGGKAEWQDEEEIGIPRRQQQYSGIRSWERFSQENTDLLKREREQVERWARRQARFRKRLLMIDPRCAITGEEELALLDAAHVVPAADDGSDIEANGLLLRIDLHRLFDAGFFRISKQGKIKVSEKLQSSHYRALLMQKKNLDQDTYARIKHALESA